MRKNVKNLLVLQVFLSFFIIACNQEKAPAVVQGQQQNQEDDSSNLAEHNFLKNTPPDVICGREGYEYLLNEYFAGKCGDTCHASGGFAPKPFGDSDPDIAWISARGIDEEDLIDTVLDNPFCGDNCNLSEEGEVFQAIEEWLENPSNCP